MLSTGSFREILFSQCGYRAGDPVLAAVSGGVDSIVLCDLLQRDQIPFAIAHVNYGLRGNESEEDEQFVAALAKLLNVAFYLRRCTADDLEKTGESSTQAAARKLRYEFFQETAVANGFQHIAVAHQADDAIETALLNFARGTGIAGLAGMEMHNGMIIRPLLPFTRKQLLDYANEHHLHWREDSSNATDAYTRNRFRHHLLPRLLEEIPQGYNGFSATFNRLKRTERLLDAALERWQEQCCTRSGNGETRISLSEALAYPAADVFLESFLHRYGFTEAQLQALPALVEGRSGTQLLSATHRLLRDREALFLLPLHNGEPLPGTLTVTEETFNGHFPDGKTAAVVDAAKVLPTLRLRRWKTGDKMIPLGMQGHRNVSDILNELKLPLHEKEKAAVVVSPDDEIVWIPGYRIAEKFRVTDRTTRVLKLLYEGG